MIQGLRITVAEDEKNMREYLRELLPRLGHQVVVAEGGRFHILYTGIPRLQPLQQVQCLAGSDDLVHWEKFVGNPVIAADVTADTRKLFDNPGFEKGVESVKEFADARREYLLKVTPAK